MTESLQTKGLGLYFKFVISLHFIPTRAIRARALGTGPRCLS